MLCALAEATERLEIGTLVVCNSFRNPALLAKMAHTVDEISEGRLILGIGAGWNESEFEAFGFPFEKVVGRFEEAVQIIRPLLREGKTSFHGKYYQIEKCEVTPRGPRKAGPPLMIGAFGPRMMRLAAQHADAWNWCYTGSAATFEEPLEKFRAAALRTGRDPDSIDATALANVVFDDDLQTPDSRKIGRHGCLVLPKNSRSISSPTRRWGLAILCCTAIHTTINHLMRLLRRSTIISRFSRLVS